MRVRPFLPLLVLLLVSGGCNEVVVTTTRYTDTFRQSLLEKVDVLLVVDNSGSMGPYQEKLGTDFGGFFDFFAQGQVDWHLAVTHTDALAFDFGQLRGSIVTSEALDPQGQFADLVNVGTEGQGIEAGLAAAAAVLEDERNGFPRDDASISVIFVSDEEDASRLSVSQYVNRYRAIRGPRQPEAFHASALTVTELADCEPEQFEQSARGTRYVEVARLTGGLAANLCVDDLAGIVVDLALTTSAQTDTFFLAERPDLSTLTVLLDGEALPCEDGGWRYELLTREGEPAPAVVFDLDRLPPPGSDILAEYERGGGEPADFCPGGSE